MTPLLRSALLDAIRENILTPDLFHTAKSLLLLPITPESDDLIETFLEELNAWRRQEPPPEKPTALTPADLLTLLKASRAARLDLRARAKKKRLQAESLRQQIALSPHPFLRTHPAPYILERIQALETEARRDLGLVFQAERPEDTNGAKLVNLELIKSLPLSVLGLTPPRSATSNMTCPFHEDRHPSAKLYEPETPKQSLHCFQCGFHGSLIDIYMKLHNVDFREALRELSTMT